MFKEIKGSLSESNEAGRHGGLYKTLREKSGDILASLEQPDTPVIVRVHACVICE